MVAPLIEGLPLAGKSILDIGCRDGWYSVQFAKLGAKSTGLDVDDTPHRRQAHEALGLSIPFIHKNLFDVEGSWDCGFIGDLLCHLENPLGALRSLHPVIQERLYVCESIDSLGLYPLMSPHVPLCLWKFNVSGLSGLLHLAGWKHVNQIGTAVLSSPTGEYANRTVVLLEATVKVHDVPGLKDRAFTHQAPLKPVPAPLS